MATPSVADSDRPHCPPTVILTGRGHDRAIVPPAAKTPRAWSALHRDALTALKGVRIPYDQPNSRVETLDGIPTIEASTIIRRTPSGLTGMRGVFGRLSQPLLIRIQLRGAEGQLKNLKRLLEA